jgi:hypothetical protein
VLPIITSQVLTFSVSWTAKCAPLPRESPAGEASNLSSQGFRLSNVALYAFFPAWHDLCFLIHVGEKANQTQNGESIMLAENNNAAINPLFLRHDLMIELGRLEMAMEDACGRQGANDNSMIETLQTKHARVAAALSKLSEMH